MVKLDTIRSDLEKRLAEDTARKSVEVRADTLDDALADAAVQLQTRLRKVEYEIIEKGFAGVLGMAKRPWVIRAYEAASGENIAGETDEDNLFHSDVFEQDNVPENREGTFFIRYFGGDVCLKIVPPSGSGKYAAVKDILASVKKGIFASLNEEYIRKYAQTGTDNTYVIVGQYRHNQSADAVMILEIASDEMSSFINVNPPGLGGADITADLIKRNLQIQGVVAGINEEKISEFVDKPVYDQDYVVAEGLSPVDGRDAYIAYNFETDRTKIKLKEAANGQVNFKELNLIQNVVEGQPLAQKMLAERGKAGKSVTGRYLEAKNGKDIALPLGKNVRTDSDGRTILAAKNGQVLLVNNKINVEPILQIDGDVSIKTGNITFLGTVVISGNVEDGFSVKASGNIEIYGTVGKATVDAEGDIIVSQGITGRGEGYVKAGRSLWAKFIENTHVDAEEFIIVSDGIINSVVSSNRKIFVQGKRGTIIGGHLFATEEIQAKTIGSSGGGSDTVLEVGFNPKSKKRLDELTERQTVLIKELEEVELNIQTLENMKKQLRRPLSPEKQENLSKLQERQIEIQEETEKISEEMREIHEYLRNLKIVGKISASSKVFAGVKIYIRDVKEEVRSDSKAVTFFLENGFVRYGKYEGHDEDLKRMPDGYTAD